MPLCLPVVRQARCVLCFTSSCFRASSRSRRGSGVRPRCVIDSSLALCLVSASLPSGRPSKVRQSAFPLLPCVSLPRFLPRVSVSGLVCRSRCVADVSSVSCRLAPHLLLPASLVFRRLRCMCPPPLAVSPSAVSSASVAPLGSSPRAHLQVAASVLPSFAGLSFDTLQR